MCVVKTDDQGLYEFDNLDPGKYRIRFFMRSEEKQNDYVFEDGAVETHTIAVDATSGNAVANAPVNCGCVGIESDLIWSMDTISIVLMMLLVLVLGGTVVSQNKM
jgi:hypothetical protein